MQEYLYHVKCKMVTLTKGINQALAYLFWIAQGLKQRPIFIYKLVPLPNLYRYHNASGYMCGGSVLLVPTILTWTLQPQPSSAKPTPDPTGAHPIF